MLLKARSLRRHAPVWKVLETLVVCSALLVGPAMGEGPEANGNSSAPVELPPGGEVPPGRTDWLVGDANGSAKSNVSWSPQPMQLGEVVEAVIEIVNPSEADRVVNVKARLNQVAYFVSAGFGGSLQVTEPSERDRYVIWPQLYLPAGARGRLPLRFLASKHGSGDLSVDIEVRNGWQPEDREVLQIYGTPEVTLDLDTTERMWYLVLMVAPVLMLLIWIFGRKSLPRDSLSRRLLVQLTAGAWALQLSLLAFFLIQETVQTWISWESTSCEVLDNRFRVEYSTSSSSSSSSSRSQTSTTYFPALALSYETPEGSRVSSGFRMPDGSASLGSVEHYVPGTITPCWFDPENPDRVVVSRALQLSTVVFTSFFLVGAFALVQVVRRASH